MTAFRGALGFAIDQIETDVRLSADGEPFILHDATLERTTLAKGVASALAWRDLSAIRIRGTVSDVIPHLNELLGLLKPGRVDLRLELKAGADGAPQRGLVDTALAALDSAGMTGRTTLTSFDRAYLAEVAGAPVVNRIWLVRAAGLDEHGIAGVIGQARAAHIPEIAIPISRAGALKRLEASPSDLRIGFYAVNDREAIEQAFALGVSAFTTDRPDLATMIRDARPQERAAVAAG